MTVVLLHLIDRRRRPRLARRPGFDLVICDEAHRTTGATVAARDESAASSASTTTTIHASSAST